MTQERAKQVRELDARINDPATNPERRAKLQCLRDKIAGTGESEPTFDEYGKADPEGLFDEDGLLTDDAMEDIAVREIAEEMGLDPWDPAIFENLKSLIC